VIAQMASSALSAPMDGAVSAGHSRAGDYNASASPASPLMFAPPQAERLEDQRIVIGSNTQVLSPFCGVRETRAVL